MAITEQADDEQRWQRYLETGASVSFEAVRAKLRGLAAEAARAARHPSFIAART